MATNNPQYDKLRKMLINDCFEVLGHVNNYWSEIKLKHKFSNITFSFHYDENDLMFWRRYWITSNEIAKVNYLFNSREAKKLYYLAWKLQKAYNYIINNKEQIEINKQIEEAKVKLLEMKECECINDFPQTIPFLA